MVDITYRIQPLVGGYDYIVDGFCTRGQGTGGVPLRLLSGRFIVQGVISRRGLQILTRVLVRICKGWPPPISFTRGFTWNLYYTMGDTRDLQGNTRKYYFWWWRVIDQGTLRGESGCPNSYFFTRVFSLILWFFNFSSYFLVNYYISYIKL